MRLPRRTSLAALPLLSAAALAGCAASAPGHSSALHQSAPAAAASPKGSAAPTPAPSPSGKQARKVSAVTTTPTCAATSLSAKLSATQGAAGHILDVFTLTNTGTATCTLNGYPSLELLSGSGTTTAVAQRHGADMAFPAVAPRLVTLPAGGVASFSVGSSDVPSTSSGCPTGAALMITPPGAGGALRVATQITPCSGFDVSPVVSGSAGVTS